jgi:MHS family proline/betaine transporter-like MFS transporter
LIAFVAIYLRDHGVDHNPNAGEYDDDDENRNNVSKQDDVSKHLLSEVFKKENLPALGSATLTPMLWGAGFYTSFVWMAIYMKVLCNPPYEHAFWINAGALLFGVILPLPLTGMLSDTLGRDKTMGFGVAGLAILGPLMIKVISAGNPVAAFFAQCTLGVCLSLFGGPMNGE